MKKSFFVVAAIIISSQLRAQQDSASKQLDEVILTSNKYPRKQSETGKVVTVISRQQIEKNVGRTLNELLNTVSGTTIIGANNNLGTNQTVSIRGASAGNSLILLDGIPVNDPSVISNYFDLNFINIDQVERIEILKGGQSTLYGSDAVAGVINIITKKAIGNKWTVSGNLTAGSYGTFKQNAGVAGAAGKAKFNVDYTHISSDGFSAAYDTTKSGNFDDDGIQQHVVNGRFTIPLAKKLSASLFGNYSTYKTDVDASAYTDDRDYYVKNTGIQSGLGLTYIHNKGEARFNYSYNRAERNYYDDSLHMGNAFSYYTRGNFIGRTHFLELYSNWKWEKTTILAGADFRYNNTEQEYFSIGMFGVYAPPALAKSMQQLSPYLSILYNTGNFTGEVGARWNNHSDYGNNFTFTLNPSISFNNNYRVFFNLYSAFKTPTLYQLFDPTAGNRDLQPENSLVGEAGLSFNVKKGFTFRLTGFYRKTDDVILYTYNPSTFMSKYANASEQKNYGGELEAGYTVGKITIQANYTYTDGKTKAAFDGTGSPIGKDTTYFNLYRIPKHAFNLDAGMQVSKNLYVAVRTHTISDREEFIYGSSPITLDGYSLLDVYGEYKFEKFVKLFIDLKNITDKEYVDIPGYSTRKFNVTGGVSFQF